MKERECKVTARRSAGENLVVLELLADFLSEATPGQFINVMVPGAGFDPFLRRPYSISWVNEKAGTLELLVQARGRGSRVLAEVREGESLSVLGPLGKGFPVEELADAGSVDLIAGACGVAPLLFLAQVLAHKADLSLRLFVGAKSKRLMPEPEVLQERFPDLTFATEDGSLGYHGTVLDCYSASEDRASVICACGPGGLMESLRRFALRKGVRCYLSLETHMACGFGVCRGCVVRASSGGYLTVCSDGPVFEASSLAR